MTAAQCCTKGPQTRRLASTQVYLHVTMSLCLAWQIEDARDAGIEHGRAARVLASGRWVVLQGLQRLKVVRVV